MGNCRSANLHWEGAEGIAKLGTAVVDKLFRSLRFYGKDLDDKEIKNFSGIKGLLGGSEYSHVHRIIF